MNVRSTITNISALMLGGLGGAGLALLFAPQSGRATRAMIHSKGVLIKERVAEEMNVAASEVKDRFTGMTLQARHQTNHLGRQLQGKIGETVGAIPMPFNSRSSSRNKKTWR